MALVNLNNNNNVMQRDKDKENERTDIPRGKSFMISTGTTAIAKKEHLKYDIKPKFVDNQQNKGKKDKLRRNKNGSGNNINIVSVSVTKASVDANKDSNRRVSAGTMTNMKSQKNPRFQYDTNQLYSLSMNQNGMSPTSNRNNSSLSPPKSDSSTSSSSRAYETSNQLRYQPQWQPYQNPERYYQPLQNENHWPQQNSYQNWNSNRAPNYNSYHNRYNRSWRSGNYGNNNQLTYRNSKSYNDISRHGGGDGPQMNQNNTKTNLALSPISTKNENATPTLSKSSSRSSLNDKSSRSSVNSSPDAHASELEYDSDTSKVSSVTSSFTSKTRIVSKGRQLSKHHTYESRSAPEMSTLNEFRSSTDNVTPPYRSMPHETFTADNRNGYYQHQQQNSQNGYYGSQYLQINNWVSNLGINGNMPNGYQMYAQDVSYDTLNNNGEFFVDGQKKQRSLSKESLNSVACSDANSAIMPMHQTETNNNYMFYMNPNNFPQQFQTTNRSRHVMNHVHRFNPSPNNKNQSTQVKATNTIAPIVSPDTFFYNTTLPFVKDEPKELLSGSKWDPISKDIWTKFLSAQQSEAMFNKKIQLWRYLYYNIRQHYPQFGLYMVGSTIAGFGTDSSDVDMCLVCRENQTVLDPRMNAMITLSQIQKLLQAYPVFDEFHLIQARVPILRFKDVDNKIEVDLNYNNCVGIRNTHLLHCYAQMDWRLRPLVLIVKLWARFHNINDARNATLPSYSLVLMVIHFLQCGVQPAVLPCLHKLHPEKFSANRDSTQIDMNEVIDPVKSENHDSLGELFVKFLEYYSKFDYARNAISIRTASCLPIEQCRQVRTPKNDTHQWKVLCIEEPFDFTNTARSVYDHEVFERVKTTFLTSWQLLSNSNRLDSVFSMPLFTPVHLYSPPPVSNNFPLLYSPIPSPTNRTDNTTEVPSSVAGDTKTNNNH